MTEHIDRMRSSSVWAGFSLAQQAFRGFEELVELNLELVKQALPGRDAAQTTLSNRTPLELWIEQVNNVRPFAEKLLAHNRQASEIVTRTHAAILEILDAEFQRQQLELRNIVEGFAKNTPAFSEAAATAAKSAVSMSSVGLETIRKTAAQTIAMARNG
ncbi:TIGR01841 family phasin [Paraburkholderia sp.]|uniref:TIGR01841 family phasin n=1 Tax=Paraburkholderia sp. TaxID=1926495 RepID=UPI0039E490E9